MNVAGAIVIYIIWWWVAFLAVLPIGVEARWEGEDDGVKGAEPGAPTAPQLKKKALMATAVAFFLWVLTVGVILSGVFNFRE
ncbi:MAG: DUF1467 family protein [Pseudomonadota bacterium]